MGGKPWMAVAAIAVVAGCGTSATTSPSTVTVLSPSTVTVISPSTVTVAQPPAAAPPAAAEPTSGPAPAPPIPGPVAAPGPPAPVAAGQCTDNDLAVTNSAVESVGTMHRVVVSFQNTSAQPCTLVGYPGADLVTAAGGLMVHVGRLPALAAHRLTLGPGELANANVQADTIDAGTGNPCPRYGTLVVTPPNGFVSHTLFVSIPICSPTISSVD